MNSLIIITSHYLILKRWYYTSLIIVAVLIICICSLTTFVVIYIISIIILCIYIQHTYTCYNTYILWPLYIYYIILLWGYSTRMNINHLLLFSLRIFVTELDRKLKITSISHHHQYHLNQLILPPCWKRCASPLTSLLKI